MSFSSETKKELCKISPKLEEMKKAEAYGMFLFCKKFSEQEIAFRTESCESALRFADTVKKQTKASAVITESPSVRKNEAVLYKVGIPSKDDCKRIFALFGHDSGQVSLRINRANIEFEICASDFLRGAFLVCGNISSPESEYHLEFNVAHKNLSEDLQKLIEEVSEFVGGRAIVPKISGRRGSYVVYIKDSDDISDFLTLIGASNASMEVMQVKIMKNIVNAKTRKVNSEIANTEKTVSAAVRQIRAINMLDECGKLQTLSEELQTVARIRKAYPLASLKELCGYFEDPISKSGLNHRLNRLVELSETDDKNKKANKKSAANN
ncbi:MAG: DNA-binding protein WhiA [Clostridia bacterium]|nr:DNA-binding protein WhiA [Clostridia bacterium]